MDINVTDAFSFHAVLDNAGGFHFTGSDVFSGRGVGETTGTVYIANQTDSSSFNGTAGVEQTAPLHFEMVSKGGSANLEVHALLHVTVHADGTMTSFVNNFTFSCL